MDVRDIDIDVSVRKFVGEEEEQNIYKTLFNRRLRISMNFGLGIKNPKLRDLIHEQIDRILDDMEVMNEQI